MKRGEGVGQSSSSEDEKVSAVPQTRSQIIILVLGVRHWYCVPVQCRLGDYQGGSGESD